MTRPILYLDVDGVLLRHPDRRQFATDGGFRRWWRAHPGGGPPNDVEGFLKWARAEFECRWLTAWAMGGDIGPEGLMRLCGRLGVPLDLLDGIHNPRGWCDNKCEGIDWDAHERGVEWFWLDDDAHKMPREVDILRARHCFGRLVTIDTSSDPSGLTNARGFIAATLARNRRALIKL